MEAFLGCTFVQHLFGVALIQLFATRSRHTWRERVKELFDISLVAIASDRAFRFQFVQFITWGLQVQAVSCARVVARDLRGVIAARQTVFHWNATITVLDIARHTHATFLTLARIFILQTVQRERILASGFTTVNTTVQEGIIRAYLRTLIDRYAAGC